MHETDVLIRALDSPGVRLIGVNETDVRIRAQYSTGVRLAGVNETDPDYGTVFARCEIDCCE